MQGQRAKSEGSLLLEQKVRAYVNLAQKNESLWSAFLVFLGALSLLSAIPFYPLPAAFVLALACGAVAYKNPPIGVALGFILVLPALSYQSAIFGWVGLMLLALVFFEVFEHWGEIALLEVLVLLPFAVFPFSLLGGLIYFGMIWGSFHFGSAKSVIISTASVFMVLLLTSIWLLPNSAFFQITLSKYPALPYLQLGKPALSLGAISSGIVPALANLADMRAVSQAWTALGQIASNMLTIALSDSGIAQMAVWAAVLFFAGWFPGKSRSRWKQTIAALPVLLVPAAYFFISQLYHYAFPPMMFLYAGISVGAVALIDVLKVTFARERKIVRRKKTQKFGKFGFGDTGDTGETMESVGGYEDVKKELRDSIMLPLQSKDLAYAYNLKVPSGILLFGPPGTGKTMLMRALANDMDYSFYPVKTPEILSQWYGESLPYSEKMLFRDVGGRVSLKEIGEVVEKRMKGEALAFDESGRARFSRITGHIKHKSTSTIYEVKTRTGRRIRVTGYHSLFSFDGSRIIDVKTSDLVPLSSYIAIPSSIPPSPSPASEINLLAHLGEDDHGLSVCGHSAYCMEAMEKLGEVGAMEILGYSSRGYMRQAIRQGRALRAEKFIALMDAARIKPDPAKISIAGKRKQKALPALVKIDGVFSTFLGLWVAEGSYNRRDTVRVSVSRAESEKTARLCRGLFGHVTAYAKGETKAVDMYIGSRPLFVLMHDVLGMEDGAHKKTIPSIAFSLGRENLAAFLRGYFSGDGTISSNQHGTCTVEATTASRSLADAALYLLLHFGIVGSVHPKKEWTGKPSWRVSFGGVENLQKFGEISFLDSHRRRKLDSYVASASWRRSMQVPLVGELGRIVSQKLPKWSASPTIGKDMLLNAGFGEEPEFFEPIRNDIYLDRVESVAEVGAEEYVYDVSVEPCQNFVAGFGGIFAHNSEKNIVEVFTRARDTAPAILFFDEIDAIGKRRDLAGMDSVTPRVLSALLQEMDGAKKSRKEVIVVGATNVPDQLDPALLRPGRFDKIIYMHLPEDAARAAIFRVQLKGLPLSKDIDYAELAKKSRRFSGADIASVIKTALRKAAEDAKKEGKVVPIRMRHLLEILEKTKPSTSLAALEDYERFKLDFERSEAGVSEEEEGRKKEKEVSWKDVAGLDDVKKVFTEAIDVPLLHPELLEEFKVKPSKGILLFGPPGCGKTLVVKAASNELDVSFLTISGAQLVQKGYTHAVNVIKETFNRARENTPSVIFVDEIESFAPARGMGRSDIVGQFLVEMDGVKENEGVLVVGATNRPDILDKAILRPGRFDKVIYVHPPDEAGREELFRIHLGKFAKGLKLKPLAQMSEGFTGADIAALSQQAKMGLLRGKLSGKEQKLTNGVVEALLSRMRPSVTPQMLAEYEEFVRMYGERK